jgi:DNA-binding transcriptional LysR family regulator
MLFYNGAMQVLNAIEDAEAQVQNVTQKPRGKIYIGTPFSIGRRFIAPAVPEFKTAYPMIDIRMRLSDRSIDIAGEGLDMAFFFRSAKRFLPENEKNWRLSKAFMCSAKLH